MLRSNNLKASPKQHVSLILSLLVLIATGILVSAPTVVTASLPGSIWSAPINLGPGINSTSNDQQPALSPDGLSLYFASNRITGSLGGFDMYVSHRASIYDSWAPPVNVGPLNTIADEGNPAFSRDGRLVFFQSKRTTGSFGGIDIWVAQRNNPHDDFDWQPAVNLGPGVNSNVDDQSPYYFEDEVRGTRQLYFGSSRLLGQGGLGGNDICVSERMADGSFGPATLVAELSSPLNENDPWIRQDGLEVFFQSNRAGSTGTALDLWVATRSSTLDAWSTPVNVGSAINTASAEQNAYFSPDSMTLFFSSDRPGGSALLDLYMSTRTLPTVISKNISVGADESCAASINPSDMDDGSFDPSGGALTFSLDPAGPLSLGSHTVRLIATDNRGVTNSALAAVTVVDQTPPAITAPPPVTVTTDATSCDAVVGDSVLGTATASDNCSVTLSRSGVPAGNLFSIGVTNITYTAIDASGNATSATQSVTVIDDTAPVITTASVDKPSLWPPDHRMVDVTVSYGATDNCGAVITALSVSSNQPVNGTGDGNTATDWEIVDPHHVRVRAERSSGGNGRIYTITITATDSFGNTSSQAVTVRVHHN